MAAGSTLVFRFTDTDDRKQSGAPCGLRLCRDQLVGLPVILATLGMAHDYGAGSSITQHFSTDVAGERAARFRVTVLSTDRDPPGRGLRRPNDQRCGRANENLDIGRA